MEILCCVIIIIAVYKKKKLFNVSDVICLSTEKKPLLENRKGISLHFPEMIKMCFYSEKRQYRMFSFWQSSNKAVRSNSLLCNYTDLRADSTCALALKRVASRNTFE